MVKLWTVTLKPAGPNYQVWREVLGEETNEVPVQSPRSVNAELGPEKNVESYLLDLSRFTYPQRSRLVVHLANKFHTSQDAIERELNERGFAIRDADVIVAFNMRAFV